MADEENERENVAFEELDVEDVVAVINPYAGGGGGSTLGHRIATSYLADLLLGRARPETGNLPVVRIAFQTNPTDQVDDLRVEAEADGRRAVLHLAARRAPQFVKSHKKTAELIATLLDQIDTFGEDEDAFVAVAVSGLTPAHREVQSLASLARDNADEAAFHAQVHEPERHSGLANRYEHLTGLVKKARPATTDDDLRDLVWSLLNRLWILDFRVEAGDESGWDDIGERLNPLARAGKTGDDVRNALHSACATQYDQKGTLVDRTVVRRTIHPVLAPDASRSTAAWAQLNIEQNSARVAVQHSLAGSVKLPRNKLRTALQLEIVGAAASVDAVLVIGESGTGKSALTLSAVEQLATAYEGFEYVALNLRRTRDSVAALSADLGMPFADVLSEVSAGTRVLVVDAADAALEGRGPLLREFAAAAHDAGLGLVLVLADVAVDDVSTTLDGIYAYPKMFEVPGLDDMELRFVGTQVPAIAGALRNLPAKSLYRRFVVVDLLARTGAIVATPLDDWGCLDLIWKNLIGRAAGGSSGAARTDSLLAMSEVELKLPAADRSYPRPDPAALDALRDDLLVAPENLLKAQPEFAHDEVRRFATAVRLARAESIAETLKASGPVRWSMSAAKLACEGKLSGAADPHAKLAELVAEFDALGDASTVRWKDVPLEAVLEMPNAYDLLREMLSADSAKVDEVLDTFIRVVSLHQRHDDMVDVPRGEPVARLVVEEVEEPWSYDDETFRLLTDWLSSALVERLPEGNPTRIALRERLLEHWRTHHPSATAESGTAQDSEGTEDEVTYNVFDGYAKPHRRPRTRTLSYRITQDRYVQLFALLGPDIDEDVRACLDELAADSPSHLKAAVDVGWSAWGLGQYDPIFLLELTEAYYIDTRPSGGWRHWNGIREHQAGGFRALANHNYGSFWVLTRMCEPADWIPVINRMLNHAANIRCRADDGSGVDESSKFVLAIDGTERTYVGDHSVWGWYRGNTNGPYPCMSALQTIERWFDQQIADGVELSAVAAMLLDGCENLAIPGLVVGAIIRHLDAAPKALDPFIVEPLVWQFDAIRVNTEAIGFMRAPDDGIANPERRKWFLRELLSLLVLQAGPGRRAEFKDMGDQLVANTARFDAGDTTVRGWAAVLDAVNMTTESAEGGVLLSVKQPDDIEEELAPMRADMARGSLLIVLQNKYWIPARQKGEEWEPPRPAEVAEDLALVKDLHENPPVFAASDPGLALAYVAAAAVKSAAAGHPEAFGNEVAFAIASVLGILGQAADALDEDYGALRFENDIGTRAAAAAALPHMLLPELAEYILAAGATPDDIAAGAAPLGPLAATDTCLAFARDCDVVWAHACAGEPCIHETAYQWVLDLARVCEIGEFDEELQHNPRVFIRGDLMARVPEIRPDRLDTPRLSATIRAVGRAAASNACVADKAQHDLESLLKAQAKAMVAQETSEDTYFIDDHGAQTMTAARALLHNRARHGGTDLLLEYVTSLVPASHVFSAFLRDLAAVGAETQELADAARAAWPTVFAHVLDQVEVHKALYERSDTFNDYALSHLLPNLAGTPESLHNELGQSTFEWVAAEELVEFIPRWLPHAAGRSGCLLELIRFLRQVPIVTQVSDGLAWLNELCLSRPDRQLPTYAPMDEWLVEIKPEADARDAGAAWLKLVDGLVYAGNKALAPYSR